MDKNNHIIIRSATLNNLKSISLDIPKNQIIVFAGVSGSGKSSVVFDTIAVESQRQLNETFSWYIRNRLPKYQKPDVVSIENLSPAIIVDQKRIGGNSRSTVGTITDIQPLLRLLFSRIGLPSAGESNHYSFNDPAGMCPECKGLGRVVTINLDRFMDINKSLNGGAILFPTFRVGSYYMGLYANTGLFDMDKTLKDYTNEELEILLYGGDIETIRNFALKLGIDKSFDDFEGIVSRFNRLYLNRDLTALNDKRTEALFKFMTECVCPECRGRRLNRAALDSKIDGYNIVGYSEMEMPELVSVLSEIKNPVGTQVAGLIIENIKRIINIGLGYLHLGRETPTLSGGESQRLKIVKHLGSSLTGMTYIFDEPSIGLHPRDIAMLNNLFTELRDKGNTVIIVEHDKDIIRHADTVVEMGPLAGEGGGEVVFNGDVQQFIKADTLTANMMRNNVPVNKTPHKPESWLPIKNASIHNLKRISVDIPEGVLTCITGVAGSGKSSLISHVFTGQYPHAVVVNQSSIATNIRSTPVTYLGIMDAIRKMFANKYQVNVGLFSFNSEGACPVCKGKGVVETDMAFMDTITTVCEHCGGRRYAPEIMEYQVNGKTITAILSLTIKQAIDFFKGERFIPKLKALYEVGLGYMTLGQSLDTLSGGELQRIKLANELKKSGQIYVMDEPTTGLHMADIAILMSLLRRMVKNGNTIVVIEHNLDVIKQADWIIDMGPGGGKNGGEVIFEGTPADLLCSTQSVTAEYLRKDIM